MKIKKRCQGCKQSKSISAFSQNRSRYDGLQTYCKICRGIYARTEKGKANQKRYTQSGKGKAAHSKAVKKHRQTTKGKATNLRTQERFNARHPNCQKAKHAVNHAIEAGKLPRPDIFLCHYCPKPAKEYHHYNGYEPKHYLDVVPVCIKCHTERKRKIA